MHSKLSPFSLMIFVLSAGLAFSPAQAQDENQALYTQYSQMEKNGFFPSNLEAAIREMFRLEDALKQTKTENSTQAIKIPIAENALKGLQSQTQTLQKQYNDLNNLPESRFAELQSLANAPTVPLATQITSAQSYVWGYPTSPHLQEAQQILATLQAKQNGLVQNEKDAEAARLKHLQDLLNGAKARTLSIFEWREFLTNKTVDQVSSILGDPSRSGGSYWYYDQPIVTDPVLKKQVGLVINFNGTRVLSISPALAP